MYCPRCNGTMIVTERKVQPGSTQTWFECVTCSGQRLLSAERPRYVAALGQPLTSRIRFGGFESITKQDLPQAVGLLR